ncbi:phage protease [Kiritimatiellaeota bacterium B1221]|nr:phage protease [Kiritimatiellaeota bacterium B1221]
MLIEAFTTISHGALAAALSLEQREASAKLPVRLKVLDWGTNDSVKGPIVLDEKSALGFAAEQKRLGKERIAIDFEHNTLPGTSAFESSSEPRRVAGYGAPVVVRGEGLFLEDIVWTPAGIAEALNYEDISPAPYLNDDRRVSALHSTALVRNGAVAGLHFFSADSVGVDASGNPNPPEKSMNEEELAAFKQLQEDVKNLLARVDALKPAPEGNSAEEYNQVVALSASVVALSGTVEAMQRDALVESATRDGKVIPLSAEELVDFPLPKLKSMIEKLPVTVPLSSEGKTRKVDGSSEVANPVLDSVARATGFSVEQLQAGEFVTSKLEAE